MAWSDAAVEDLAARIAALPVGPRLVGIDGHGGAGKSTLADALARLTGAVVVRTDDLYLPRAERLERFLRSPEPLTAYDVARLEEQVIAPLLAGRPARWQRYDWDSDGLSEWHDIEPGGVLIVEGVTALHPRLRHAYGLRVWVSATRRSRFERMLARDHGWPEAQLTFWIADEDAYVERYRPDLAADVRLDGDAGESQDLADTEIRPRDQAGAHHRGADRSALRDAARLRSLLAASWGGTVVVSRGVARDAAELPALLAERHGELVGALTYAIHDGEMEVVTLDAAVQGQGVGGRLLAAAIELARGQGLRRVWLVTTNDNLVALRFYQRRGLRLAAVHRGAVDQARRLKPSIPATGARGIELHDELEMEIVL